MNKYSFPYSLSPARYWKSAGELEVVLNSNDFRKNINTNLGSPSVGNVNSFATWSFSKFPDMEVIEFNYNPEINSIAKSMINIEPLGLTVIAGLILTVFHLIFIRDFRIRKPDKKISWILVIGSIIIPFFIYFHLRS